MATGFFPLHSARCLNQVAVQQQLFSNGGFTSIRVGNNGEGAPLADFVEQAHGFRACQVIKRGIIASYPNACPVPRGLPAGVAIHPVFLSNGAPVRNTARRTVTAMATVDNDSE